MPGAIVQAVAEMGIDSFLEEMKANDWWNSTLVDENLLRGYTDGRMFDRAENVLLSIENIRYVNWEIVALINGILETGDVARAERIYQTYKPIDDDLPTRISLAKIVSRAMRGEGVLDDARALVKIEEQEGRWSRHIAQRILGQAAIATIGYTVEMKKRIEEYGKR
jgi:hypothetical protein